ncbi:MAG: DEAD/DEAH box helicase [Vicinamibacteria bacterium]|nr:DEAD/DEAH box helicase [Vicinamibacteria bacterium]
MSDLVAPLAPAAERVTAGLSAAQREAVLHGQGPLLIIAGAGTGKTTVLTRRIAHLITSRLARPEQILALTFTDKAALEMAERVDQLIPYGYAETWIATFHAFGDKVLRDHALDAGLDPGFRVLTQPEQVIFLRERLWRLPLSRYRPPGDPTRHLQALVGFVSRAKDEDVGPAELRACADARAARAGSPEERDDAEALLELAAFYESYQSLLAEASCLDFGDQIHRALRLLRERPAVLARLRERFPFVLVDEFQDTNHSQLELLRLLAEGGTSLTVVGDDDQAIYRWRGAASGNLIAFRELFPDAKQVVLVENHRSTQEILDCAGRLVAYNNPYRLEVVAGIDKRLVSQRGPGEPPRHRHFDSVSAESDAVAAEIEALLSRGHRPRDVAVLVRSNADADPFLRALNVRGIPHRFSGSRGLYAREEVRLLVAFLRLLAAPDDSVSAFYLAASELYRVPPPELLRLNRFASRKTRPLLEVFRALPDEAELAAVGGAAREAVARLLRDLDAAAAEMASKRTGEVLYLFLQGSGLLAKLAAESSAEAEARVKNIARFFQVVRGYGDVAVHDRVPDFVAHLELLRDAGDDPAVAEADPDEDAVQVLTVHKAKGLEFAAVFLVGAAEGKFPVQRRRAPLELPEELVKSRLAGAGADAELMEERRLFYVAMTRAKESLLLTSAADYGTARPRKVSRFVVEALDLPSPSPALRRSQAREALERERPAAEPPALPPAPLPADAPLSLSCRQVDDYRTCPLKYKYVHRLRVPLPVHHRVVYGNAVHHALQAMFKARLEGRPFAAEDLVAAFRAAWVSEGFLSRAHEEERRATGERNLRRFFDEDAAAPLQPTGVEEEFAFFLGATKVQGRYDLVVQDAEGVAIVDFKTGAVRTQKEADQRAKDSLQLDLYALAHERLRGALPARVELRFVESGRVGSRRPEPEQVREAERVVEEVARALRARDFTARPSYRACAPCAFHDICPHTAWHSE